jgi:hypothetical protein
VESVRRPSTLGRIQDGGGERVLRYATALYAAGLAAHTADHLRRGTGVLSWEVFWAGMLSTAVGLITIALVFARHHLAPLLAGAAGLTIAVGVGAVHLLPHWSALSDAFPGAQGTGVTALSWTVVLLEISGALAVGAAGLHLVRRQRFPTAAPGA